MTRKCFLLQSFENCHLGIFLESILLFIYLFYLSIFMSIYLYLSIYFNYLFLCLSIYIYLSRIGFEMDRVQSLLNLEKTNPGVNSELLYVEGRKLSFFYYSFLPLSTLFSLHFLPPPTPLHSLSPCYVQIPCLQCPKSSEI